MLDAGPLGKIAHPRPNQEVTEWLTQLLDAGVLVILPEIADYEIRRSLLLNNSTIAIARLDRLKTTLTYLPLNTSMMMRAAELWAKARKQGRLPADPKELNGDVILAAQAEQASAVVATENIGHLSLFVDARRWREITN
jgi:predicted nucleic acid-binding protein